MCSMIFSSKKPPPFYAIKTKSWKSRKIEFFPKGLVPGFGPQLAICEFFFLGNLGQENVCNDILERKNAFLCYKNKELKHAKNWDFFKGVSPWFWSKVGHFFIFFFWGGNLGQENVFYDILERKNTFLGYKNKELKQAKNWDFSKGVSP